MMMGIFLEKRKENNIKKNYEVHFLKEMPDAERVCWLKFVWIGGGNLNGLQQDDDDADGDHGDHGETKAQFNVKFVWIGGGNLNGLEQDDDEDADGDDDE